MDNNLVEASKVDLNALGGAKPRISGMTTAFNLEARKEYVIFLTLTNECELTAKGTRVSAMTLTWYIACWLCCLPKEPKRLTIDCRSSTDPGWTAQAAMSALLSK